MVSPLNVSHIKKSNQVMEYGREWRVDIPTGVINTMTRVKTLENATSLHRRKNGNLVAHRRGNKHFSSNHLCDNCMQKPRC
jgi:hypothetical protein